YVEGNDFHGFEQISSDPAVVTKLVTAFTGPSRNGTPGFLSTNHFGGNITPFIPRLSEGHLADSALRPLFHTIVVAQLMRLRSGDGFFCLNESCSAAEQSLFNAGNSLAKVIKLNTDVTNLQDDVFKFLTQENGQSSSFYTSKDGQAALTGSSTGSQLTESLYN